MQMGSAGKFPFPLFDCSLLCHFSSLFFVSLSFAPHYPRTRIANPPNPLQHSEMLRTPDLSKICPGDFLRVPAGGTGICQTFVKMSFENYHFKWETDFYTPPVLGGAALLPFSAPAVYKNQGP